MKNNIKELLVKIAALTSLAALVSCSAAGPVADQVNPFAEEPAVTLGERSTSAVLGAGGGSARGAEEARQALEALASYRRGHSPQPVYPVIKPAEVRLMWVPDHLTTDGNLVPAHYYYLKVMHDDWEVQDAFEIEGQLSGNSAAGTDLGTGAAGGETPFVYKEGRR